MPQPMQYLDLPRIYQAAEATKGARLQNQLYSAEVDMLPQRKELLGAQNRLHGAQADMAERQAAIARLTDMSAALDYADTPEKFDHAIDVYAQEGIPGIEQYRGKFANRELYRKQIADMTARAQAGEPLQEIFDPNSPTKSRFVPRSQAAGQPGPQRKPLVEVNTGTSGIDYGDPPKDHVWARDEGGKVLTEADPKTGYRTPVAVPIRGGPVAAKIQAEEEAAQGKQAQKVGKANVVVEDIDRVLGLVHGAKIPVTGVGSFLSVIPGTTAKDVSSLVDTIKANVGFDQLQKMREASPTGGALGQVSEMENRLLQSVLGSLDQAQGQDQFEYNLRRLKDTFLDIIHGPGNRPGTEEPETGNIEETKVLNGKTYVKIGGKWYEHTK